MDVGTRDTWDPETSDSEEIAGSLKETLADRVDMSNFPFHGAYMLPEIKTLRIATDPGGGSSGDGC